LVLQDNCGCVNTNNSGTHRTNVKCRAKKKKKSTLPRMFSAKDYIYILKSMPVFEARFSISDYDMMRK